MKIRTHQETTMTNPATGQVPATEETPEDATRRLARRLYAIERLCSGRPGYHTITVKALLTAMNDADDEQAAGPQRSRATRLLDDELVARLQEAADALTGVGKAAIVVKPTLDTPYPDDPRWTPWTRFMEQPARRAYNLGIQLRRELRAASRPNPEAADTRQDGARP